ncbi:MULTISPECIES: dihydrodipicolinate synthase family protein [Paracoccus]|jgi:4-hydroxy-tetrahydrodipicolinate synthase|uniref:Dihydrodipicolinate synthetase n=1 Tax=Paracoccus denitrificans (strain Pd 1222) TaxID=318586 RepID=A1B7K1_PARDP|nr:MULTISPECIES: dihydrodipicolinate synthase family protein [Paracoccus]ABL71495.1 dihydrodipicolinate synthetase [Paracoccus denitrificans PD1222]MBB4629756.1 4-hydroxy-tetrahydrodipicolinate synthase [Paracoccus denitrificans]MCU7431165.1 dihydrodipicolinate synthase family protein [Paracoccus denitrificans]QAR28096.1 dihydrodipicolinate synthase family protein [Paracoccus denitrificans]UPV97823.1 dihydrodipicolinate synthase family protein [Paracoccus denitrificans]
MAQRIGRDSGGVFIIAATPFTDRGEIDHDSLRRLVDFYAGHGVTGLTILGMMGEANKMTPEERRAVVDTVIDRAAGLPVIVGVSDAGMRNLTDLAGHAMDRGAAGVMVAPAAGPAREDRIEGYFHAVAQALGPDVPMVFQDFPLATGLPVSAALIRRLSSELPQMMMLKHEDWPGLSKITALRADEETPGTPRLSILVGNGGLYLPQELQRGADGAMTGFAYPEALVQTVALHRAGQVDAAEDFFDRYLPILRHEQQPGFGLAVRKHVLMRRGAIASAATRAPGPRLSATDIAEVERLMARLETRLAA